MTSKEKYEIIERIAKLSTVEQLEFIEELVAGLREAFTDHAAFARQMEAMAADPDMQRVLRNEDLEKPNVAG